MNLKRGKIGIGKLFPNTLIQENFSFKEEENLKNLQQIYNYIIMHYLNTEWSLEDFKDFRHALITCSIEEFAQFQDLICYFLSLSSNDAMKQIIELNQALNFDIFTKRVLEIKKDLKTGEEISRYSKMIERDYQVIDIVEITKRINALPYLLVSNFVTKVLEEESSTRTGKLEYCERLMQSESVELELLVESINQAFQELCQKVSDQVVLDHLQSKQSQFTKIVIEIIKKYYQREKRTEFREKNSEIRNYKADRRFQWQTENLKMKKTRKRK